MSLVFDTGQPYFVERVLLHKDIIDSHKKKVAEEEAQSSNYSKESLEELLQEQENLFQQSNNPNIIQKDDMVNSQLLNLM